MIIPFGKYRGQPVEVLAGDKGYLDWCRAQPELVKRYVALFDLLKSMNDSDEDCTPEHNQLQARFFDDAELIKSIVRACLGDQEYELGGVRLEAMLPNQSHADVLIVIDEINPREEEERKDVRLPGGGWTVSITKKTVRYRMRKNIAVELKPAMGDDYPKILRNLNRTRGTEYQALVCESYSGSVHIDVVRRIFKESGVVFMLIP